MRKIHSFIIHCAATKPSMDIGVKDIDRWHRARGWLKVGYHFVIKRDGTLEEGRNVNEVGAHAKGHNTYSIGICLAGGIDEEGNSEDNFTDEQKRMLCTLLYSLRIDYPNARTIGHNEISSKECPCFDIQECWDKFKPTIN